MFITVLVCRTQSHVYQTFKLHPIQTKSYFQLQKLAIPKLQLAECLMVYVQEPLMTYTQYHNTLELQAEVLIWMPFLK